MVFAQVAFLTREEVGEALEGYTGKPYSDAQRPEEGVLGTGYAMELEEPTGEACNHIYLTGALCKPPTFRKTPLGRSICDLMLAVSRKYGRADYLPVIAWGQLALRTAKLQVGDPLALEGRIQSRPYQKLTDAGPETRIAYEVSMMHLLELPPENL